MKQTRDQRVLCQRFLFRLLVLLFSVAGCILYGNFNNYSPTVWAIILGLSGSALVWSFVELFDFFIETYRQFTNERSQFFIMTEVHWSQLRSIFRSDISVEELPWEKIADIVDDLYSKTASFPFQGGIYSISKEFESAVDYITRMYWKSHGYQHSIAQQRKIPETTGSRSIGISFQSKVKWQKNRPKYLPIFLVLTIESIR